MPGETERLRERLQQVNPHPADPSVAGLLTMADTVSAHLLATALHRAGRRATVLAGSQLGLTTDSTYMWARVREVDPAPLVGALAEHDVVVIPGGQAVDAHNRPTWLGKNSSDLSALLVAAVVGAGECEIHSDVDGIYSADPNLVTGTRLLPAVSYEVATALSLHGAKVLHRRAVRLAQQHGIAIVCRHNRAPFPAGTTISAVGSPTEAVIVNRRSVVLGYQDDAQADLAHAAFHAQGVDTTRLEGAPQVAVIGGYLDLEEFQRRHHLPPARVEGIPVCEVHGSRVTTHLAPDEYEAVVLAQRLHDDIAAPARRLTSV